MIPLGSSPRLSKSQAMDSFNNESTSSLLPVEPEPYPLPKATERGLLFVGYGFATPFPEFSLSPLGRLRVEIDISLKVEENVGYVPGLLIRTGDDVGGRELTISPLLAFSVKEQNRSISCGTYARE